MNNKKLLLYILLILTAGFLLRIWNISFGLPYLYHPDEPMCAIVSVRIFRSGNLNPHFFHYPSLWFYLNVLFYIPLFLIGKLLGFFNTISDIKAPFLIIMGCGKIATPSVILIGRLLAMGFGMGSLWFIYKISKTIFNSTTISLLALLFAAVCPTLAEYNHYMTTESALVFFVLVCIYYSVKISTDKSIKNYILAGIACGLAASSKYNGAPVIMTIFTAHFLSRGFVKGLKDKKILVAVLSSALAFFLTTPYAILGFNEFYKGLSFDAVHYSTGHDGMEGKQILWYIKYLFFREGLIVYLGFAGIVLGLLRKNKKIITAGSFPLIYTTFIFFFTARNSRTILPAVTVLIITGSFFTVYLVSLIFKQKKIPEILSYILTAILLIVLLYVPVYNSIRTVKNLYKLDSRETARVWIEQNIPKNSKLAIEAYSPYVDKNSYILFGTNKIIEHTPAWYKANKFDYIVFSQGMYIRFFNNPDLYKTQISRYNMFFNTFEPFKIFNDGGYEVKIYKINH